MTALKLTARQAEIWALVARGYSNGEIAEICDLREPTVNAYLTRVYGKLYLSGPTRGVYRVQAALAYWRQQGFELGGK